MIIHEINKYIGIREEKNSVKWKGKEKTSKIERERE